VTVFRGTGFVGRRIVKHFHELEFSVRIASRHPERDRVLFARVPLDKIAKEGAPQLAALRQSGPDLHSDRRSFCWPEL
jgi:uncharacterized protein YbjT (DUF2867 family)